MTSLASSLLTAELIIVRDKSAARIGICLHFEAAPFKDEVSEECADENAKDDITIVIHGKQHHKVSDSKLETNQPSNFRHSSSRHTCST